MCSLNWKQNDQNRVQNNAAKDVKTKKETTSTTQKKEKTFPRTFCNESIETD